VKRSPPALAYLVVIHVVMGAVILPMQLGRWGWLLLAELLLVVSLLVGVRLTRGLDHTLEVIASGVQFLREGDFTARLRPSGRPQLDQLIGVYNQMVDHLRDERTRLQEQHHFLAQILESSPSAVVVLDFEGGIDLCNPAAERLLGLRAEACRGRRLSSLAASFPSPVAETLQTLAVGETRVMPLSDGRRLKCRHGTFQDRGFARAFFTIEELTEELRQAEKAAYEKLIRMMSHEVNNSVGATGSLLHSCLNYRALLPEEQGQDLETALRVVITRIEQLGSLMRSFAEVVRLPAAQLRPCDPQELLRRVALLLRAECDRRGVAWKWEIEQPAGLVSLDPVQMEQVLMNIAKNAMEAIVGTGTITVRIGRREQRPFIAIEDTGPGIMPEARAHLFTPFFSTKDGGQGIGLMLIQQILVQHRFDYTLEGPPGGPTRFTIVLR
jgi:two-component system, NtrC family, nitrogen regulation sensor histidine kinase NtrY